MGCLDACQDAVDLPVDSGGEQPGHVGVKDAGAKPVRGAYCVPDGLGRIRRVASRGGGPQAGKQAAGEVGAGQVGRSAESRRGCQQGGVTCPLLGQDRGDQAAGRLARSVGAEPVQGDRFDEHVDIAVLRVEEMEDAAVAGEVPGEPGEHDPHDVRPARLVA